MIDRKELHIGNYVKSKSNKVVKLGYISKRSLYLKQPIPLTIHWIERLGFANVNGVCWTKGDIIAEDADGLWEVSFHSHKILFIRFVKYVHQLQNIFYWLTDEPLDIID